MLELLYIGWGRSIIISSDDPYLKKPVGYLEDDTGARESVKPKIQNLSKDSLIDQILYRNTYAVKRCTVLKHHILNSVRTKRTNHVIEIFTGLESVKMLKKLP